MMFRLLMVFFLVFVANFCVDTGSSRKPKFGFSDESDTSETSSDESNDSTGDDSSDSNEDSDGERDSNPRSRTGRERTGNGTPNPSPSPTPPQIKPSCSAISKVISMPYAPVEKEYTFQELFGFEKMRSAYVDFRVCPSHVHLICERLMLNT